MSVSCENVSVSVSPSPKVVSRSRGSSTSKRTMAMFDGPNDPPKFGELGDPNWHCAGKFLKLTPGRMCAVRVPREGVSAGSAVFL